MMNDPRAPGQAAPGLCGRCQHVQPILSARGSTFYLCRLSAVDPGFPRYPRLPVLECGGFAHRSESEQNTEGPVADGGRPTDD